MPLKIKLQAIWRSLVWAVPFLAIVSGVTIWSQMTLFFEPTWPLWALLASVVLMLAWGAYWRFTKGPYHYEAGPLTIICFEEQHYVDPAFFENVMIGLANDWIRAEDTRATPHESWKDYTLVLENNTKIPAGRHFRNKRTIILHPKHHKNRLTLRWELGHALMYEELSARPKSEREKIGIPQSNSRTHEPKWATWRGERGLL